MILIVRKIILVILVISATLSNAQIGVGTPTPDATLDIRATNPVTPNNTDGILIPRIDSFPITNPTAAQNGMLIFLTTATTDHPVGFYYWNNTYAIWKKVDTGNVKYWEQSGNLGTIEGTDFIGTTDAQDLDIRINNIIKTRITSKGQIETLNTGQSVFIGENAGRTININVAEQDVFIGYNAASLSSFYSYCVANGYSSLYNNNHGDYNTANGYYTLYDNDGQNNVAIGYQAIYKNINPNGNGANNNTALGSRIFYNTFGSYNTGIGHIVSGFTSPARNYTILLGYVQASTSQGFYPNVIGIGNDIELRARLNYLNIGNLIYAHELANPGASNSYGKVGIGTPQLPIVALVVNGAIKVESTTNTQIGTIRWSGTDFEGYDGNKWLSLTKKNSFWNNDIYIETEENQIITASDGVSGDNFGYAVAISGDYAIIGAYRDDIGGNTNQGAAYIFKRTGTTWTEEAKITASDGTTNDFFGNSVAISGDYAIIGAYLDDVIATDQGAAYIFKRTGTSWNQEAKITAADYGSNDRFGFSVSIDGDYAVIGAFYDTVSVNFYQGSAYVFKRAGTAWNQESKLIASDGAGSDYFGHSVAISNDYIIVGAYRDNIGANTNQGSAYIFKRTVSDWNQEAKLLASDGAEYDYFGDDVAIYGSYAIVGVPYDDVGSNTDQGSSYIYKREGTIWNQETQITASDGVENDNFGMSISIYNEYVIVGAYQDQILENISQGSAYIFRKYETQWGEKTKLIASDGTAGAYFGQSVSIYGDYSIIGAPGNEKAYFFNR